MHRQESKSEERKFLCKTTQDQSTSLICTIIDDRRAVQSSKRNKTLNAITQCMIDEAGGSLTLSISGYYYLAENIKGSLIIAADSIFLDLKSHVLDASDFDVAISIGPISVSAARPSSYLKDLANTRKILSLDGINSVQRKDNHFNLSKSKLTKITALTSQFKHIVIENGSITGSDLNAILINNVFDIKLKNLTLYGNLINGIHVINTGAIDIENVNFTGETGGERAIFIENSNSVSIHDVTAENFSSSIGSIIQIEDSHTGSLKNISLSLNTLTSAEGIDFFDAASAVLGVFFSEGFNFENVIVNNNTFEDVNIAPNWRTWEAIILQNCKNCTFINCQTSENSDLTGTSINIDTEDYFFCLLFCDTIKIIDLKSNSNETPKIAFFAAVAIFDSSNVIIENSQADSNTLQELEVGFSVSKAFWLTPYFNNCFNVTMRNCQANFNTVVNAGAARSGFNVGVFSGIHMSGSGFLIDSCEASDNVMLAFEAQSMLVGIFVSAGSDTVVRKCVTKRNLGGDVNAGALTYQPSIEGFGQITFDNLESSTNDKYGITIGTTIPVRQFSKNVIIKDCTIISNGSIGINVFGLHNRAEDIIIRQNILIGNNIGVSINDSVSRSTIENNLAQDNILVGFQDLTSPCSLNLWLSNKAICNAVNYEINWGGNPPVIEGTLCDNPKPTHYTENISVICDACNCAPRRNCQR